MRSRALLVAAAMALPLMMTGGAVMRVGPQRADPELVVRFRQKLSDAVRITAQLELYHHGEGSLSPTTIHAELPTRRAEIRDEDDGLKWLYQDGELTLASWAPSGPARIPEFEPFFAALLAQLDGGLPDVRFIPELPPLRFGSSAPAVAGSRMGGVYGFYRLDLAGSADDALRIFVELRDDPTDRCLLAELWVFPAESDEPLSIWPAMFTANGPQLLRHPSDGTVGMLELHVDACGRIAWDPEWNAPTSGALRPFESRSSEWVY